MGNQTASIAVNAQRIKGKGKEIFGMKYGSEFLSNASNIII